MSPLEWIDFQEAFVLIFQPMIGWGITIMLGCAVIFAVLEGIRDFGNFIHIIDEGGED